jgi:hypothetical protein
VEAVESRRSGPDLAIVTKTLLERKDIPQKNSGILQNAGKMPIPALLDRIAYYSDVAGPKREAENRIHANGHKCLHSLRGCSPDAERPRRRPLCPYKLARVYFFILYLSRPIAAKPLSTLETLMTVNERLAAAKPHRSALCWLIALVLAAWQLVVGVAMAQTATVERKRPAAGKLQPVDKKDPKIGHDWVRLEHNDTGELLGMQTAIVRYTNAASKERKDKPIEVDLIGAVHIGDAAYYRKLNEQFKQYDVLLYELVAPEGTVVERGRGTSNAHPLGAMQNGMKNLLELEHQLEKVDYTQDNFVHADMSPDEFAKSMKDRNESFLQMYFRLLGQAMAHQSEMQAKGESVDFDLLSALFATDRPRKLKIVLAKQLSEMEGLMVSFGGEQGSTIISERNKKALEVLNKQLAAGKKRIGIFYGAGHLNDMDERLRKDFQLEPTAITWLTAWNLAATR